MSAQNLSVLFPPGRIVQGNLYKVQDKDMDGRPRVYPAGHPKAGQPKRSWFFAVAIPKGSEQHWSQTQWGGPIWAFGHTAWPSIANPQTRALPGHFAWKIDDGDDTAPNRRGRVNANTEGMPGHWIVSFSNGFAPRICDAQGNPITEENAVKPGYYVEVFAQIASNNTPANPGIYVNPSWVAFRAYGPEITAGADPRTLGFGSAALPPGASSTPPAGASFPAAAAPSPSPYPPAGPPSAGPGSYPPNPALPSELPASVYAGLPPAPAPAYGAPPAAPGAAPAPAPSALPPAPAGAPTAVAPAPGFLAPPGAPAPAYGAPAPAAAPPPPPAPAPAAPAPAAPRMTAKASGTPYAEFIAKGWTDAQLRANGYMV